jgi:hypothetical protein
VIRLSARPEHSSHIPGLLPSRWSYPGQSTCPCCNVPWTQDASQIKEEPISASPLPPSDNTQPGSTSHAWIDGYLRPGWKFLQWRWWRFASSPCPSVSPAQPATHVRSSALPTVARPRSKAARVCRHSKPGWKENRRWRCGLPFCNACCLEATTTSACTTQTHHHRLQQINSRWSGSGNWSRPWKEQSRQGKAEETRVKETWRFSCAKLMLDPDSLDSASWLRMDVSGTACYVSARVAIVLFVLCCPNYISKSGAL